MESTSPLIKQLKLNAFWFTSVLEDIKPEDGSKIAGEHTNSLEWIAGHLNVGRYRNLIRLGCQVDAYPYLDRFANPSMPPPNAIAFDQSIQYPSLSESVAQWQTYAKMIMERLETMDDSVLKTELPFQIPIGGNTIEDAMFFAAMHESYHIGQMSMIRKLLGYSSMRLLPKNK